MELKQKIIDLVQLGETIQKEKEKKLAPIINLAHQKNKWFTKDNIYLALEGIGKFLEKKNLDTWLGKYNLQENKSPQKVGIVMAGNIPLVGFHDFLTVFLSGNNVVIKMSSDDDILLKALIEIIFEINPKFKSKVSLVERLKDIDAVIATGSNNTARYFEYYFGKHPHIIRKNRNSCAVFNGKESIEDLKKLAPDIFQYFGLGCRSISKLYLPKKYNFQNFFESIKAYESIIHHNKYNNNYTYNKAVFLMNQIPHLDNGFLLLNENNSLASRTGILNFEYYNDEKDLTSKLDSEKENIQLITSNNAWFKGSIDFGTAQQPELWDYADGIDTMAFLLNLPKN